MKSLIKTFSVSQLKPEEAYHLSYPLNPGFYGELASKLSPLPLIVVNKENQVLFGIDYFHYLKENEIDPVEAMQVDLNYKDALILGFNLKEKYIGFNLYEKLVFIKKVLPAIQDVGEVYRRTSLDIGINPELKKKIDMLLSEEFARLLIKESVVLKTALKLCDFVLQDREVLITLFRTVSFTSSHQQKILEMVEEVLFRDKCLLSSIFDKLMILEMVEADKTQKNIIDALFRYRYPVYMEAEEKWQEQIKSLRIPSNMRVTHYQFFEKQGIDLTVQVKDIEELKLFLASAASRDSH